MRTRQPSRKSSIAFTYRQTLTALVYGSRCSPAVRLATIPFWVELVDGFPQSFVLLSGVSGKVFAWHETTSFRFKEK